MGETGAITSGSPCDPHRCERPTAAAPPSGQPPAGHRTRRRAARARTRAVRTRRYRSAVRMVGLTGGIGAGKSAVGQRLARHGAVIIDADALAREVVDRGTAGLAEVVAAFGDGVLDASGALDRPALGRIVFADPDARERLEAIVHPRVRARTAEIIAGAPEDAVVVNDVPLLVE